MRKASSWTVLVFTLLSASVSASPWGYTCDRSQNEIFGTCRRQKKDLESLLSLTACTLTCSLPFWPLPTVISQSGTSVTKIHPDIITLTITEDNQEVNERLERAVRRQLNLLTDKSDGQTVTVYNTSVLNIQISVEHSEEIFNLDTNESYNLGISKEFGQVNVDIKAPTFLGARHGVETLFQVLDWDMDDQVYLILDTINIQDSPYFKHRGLSLDTARNFISVEKIKQVLDTLSYSKMNVLHWHLTDSQSFPLEVEFEPEFTMYGAYSTKMIYTKENVRQIIEYAADRGIVVIPEIDAPAHVGAGWEAVNPNFTLCVGSEPWQSFCVQAPCGQLNPVADGMYHVLGNIFKELIGLFGPNYFHMGGDEVHLGCWNSSDMISTWLDERDLGREEADFMTLWNYYQTKALDLLDNYVNISVPPTVYLWTSHLTTPEYLHYLDPARYTIQIWKDGGDTKDPTIKALAEGGYKMVFSNVDSVYLDCGFGSWVGDGNNWCSPYKGWQLLYENNPLNILERHGVSNLEEAKSNVMGGEVAMWTEQTDGNSLLTKIEPRTSAYAECLWRGDQIGKWREAETRMVIHRERLIERGITADALTQRWCLKNPDRCLVHQ